MKSQDKRRLNAALKLAGAKPYHARMAAILAVVHGVDYAVRFAHKLQAKGLTDKPPTRKGNQ